MSATSELASASKDTDVQRPELGHATQPAAEPGSAVAHLIDGRPIQRSASRNVQLLQAKPLVHSANAAVRVVALKRAQQTHGNRFVQRALQPSAHPGPAATVQRRCACGGTCEECRNLEGQSLPETAATDGEHKPLVQRQARDESGSPDAASLPEGSASQPLDPATRALMESRLGGNYREVQIHTDAPAQKSATAFQADAYTVGNHIYFAEGKYRPESPEGAELLVHELTHVEQQSEGQSFPPAPAAHRAVVVGSPDDPMEREADARAAAFGQQERTSGRATPDHSGTVRRAGWNSLTDNPVTNTIGSGVRRGTAFIAQQIERLAPGAVKFFRNIRDYFTKAINKGVDGVFGGIIGSIREKGLAATIADMIGSFAAGALNAVGGFIAGQCGALGRLAEHLVEVAAKLGGNILDQTKKGFEAIRGALDDLWTEYGAPALDWVKKKLKAIWKDVETTARKFWDWLKPLRDDVSFLWNEVTDFLVESRRDFDGWLDWFVPKAIEAWEEVKAKLKPYMQHVKTAAKVAGAVLVLLSPAGPFVVIGVVVYALYQGAKALWEKWGKKFTQQVREWWVSQGVPTVQNKLKEFRTKLDSIKEQIRSGLQQLHDVFMQVLGALGVLTFLEAVKNILDTVAEKIRTFKDKLEHKLHEWSDKIHALLAAADPYLQQIKEAFRQSLLIGLLGPYAILDDGVWGTVNRMVSLAMRTPCLRELGGLLRVPMLLQRLGAVRAGIKEGIEVIKNPDPLLEKMKAAIAPMIATIEPEIRARISSMYSDREIMIQVSIAHYLSDSLKDLGQNWWEHLKKMGGDLLWPWPEVAKEFMPMVDDFGAALNAVFDLEFNIATDKFLSGMKKFNGIAGALAGWFTIASVLVGAALGALGFAFGPAGVATVGAGAAAGLEFAEGVGMALLIIALSTEAAVIMKADFDLKFQNPRIADAEQRQREDQEDCKAIAGSLISVVTIGALMLLADIAARFAKFLYGLVENVPLVRDIAALLKSTRESVGEFSLKKGKTGAPEAPPEARVGTPDVPTQRDAPTRPADADTAGRPADADPAGRPAEPASDLAATAEQHGIPPERLQAEVGELRQKAADPGNVRRPGDRRYDAEMDAQGHTFDREQSSKSWCRHTEEACGLSLGSDLNAKVDAALKEKPPEPVTETPLEQKPTETPATRETEPGVRAEDVMSPEQKAFADRLEHAQDTARDLRNERRLLEAQKHSLEHMPPEQRLPGRRQRLEEIEQRLAEINQHELPNAENAVAKAELDLRNSNLTLYQKVRAATPRTAAAEAKLRLAKGHDQVSGLPSANLQVDHIVPVREITSMPGFDKLTWEEQIRIVDKSENLAAMDGSANASKGARSWEEWPQASEYYPDPAVRAKMIAKEQELRVKIQSEIAELARSR
jgi:hypothetical protein